jgi:DNA-binding IclR family transcriptional regulator
MTEELKSVRKAFAIVTYLASRTEPCSFTQIRSALKLGKATAHRFLATLEDLGLVNRSANSGQYRLGLAAIRIGVAAGNQIELRRELRPYLRDLMERTGETANLVILDGTRPVFIDNVESPQNLRLLSRIGRRTHPYCTSVGKALLAYMKPEELETILAAEPFERRTERSIMGRESLLKELRRVRAQGYAVDDEESESGAQCIGAPLLDHTGRAIAALSISGPASRISRSDHPRIGRIVREVAERARRALGFAGRGESPKDGNA